MSAPLAPVPVPQLLKYAEDVELNVAPQQVNFVDLDGYGHRVAITLLTSVMNSAFYWSRPVDSVRPIGHFSDPTGAFAASLLASLNTEYTDNDAVTDKLTFDSAALNSNIDPRIREGGNVSANDLMMAYVLYKVYGSSSAATQDIVFNLHDAYGMLKSSDYADAIMSAFNNSELETSNPGNEKGAIDAMFRDLLASDSLRFFDAYGNQVPGIYEVSSDLSGSGTWNLVDGDTIEVRTVFTFVNSVTLRSSLDVAQNLNPLPTQSNGETVFIPAGTKLALRLQLVASDEGVSAPPSGSLSTVPTAPTSLALTAGNNSIFVSWDVPVSDGNSVVTAYNLYLNGTKITSMYGVFYTIRGLNNGGTYSVAVAAVNPRGESALATASVSLPMLTAQPGAPTALALTPGDGTLTASWEAPVSNGGAAVIAYTVYNGDVAVASTTNLFYTIPDLTNGSFYRISVTATNSAGEGVKCTVVSGTPRIAPPRPASQVPTAPTSLSLMSGNGTIAAVWGLPVSNGAEAISSYNVYRDGLLIASPTSTSYIFTGLQNGRSYSIAVSAVNLIGEGSLCAAQSITPFSPPLPNLVAPDAPTNLQLTAGNGLISASWTAPANNGGSSITAYRLYIDNNVIPYNSTQTSYTFSSLMNGYNYMVSISAVNAIGVGVPCISASATPLAPSPPPPAPTAPTAPTSLALVAGNATIAVSWGLPVSNGGAAIATYKVYNYGALVGSSFTTSYNMTGLQNGTNYSITVSAENSAGEGVPCAAQQATPVAPGPIIVEGLLSGYIGPIPANVTLGANVSAILPSVFQNSAIQSLDLSATNVTSFDQSTFYNCASLTSVLLPQTLVNMPGRAFYNCPALTSIVIPDSVTFMGDYTCSGCTLLSSVTLPAGLLSMGNNVFESTALTSVVMPNSVTSIGSAFGSCSALTSITLSSGLLNIGSNAFAGCAMTSILIPSGVTSLGGGAFSNCNQLLSAALPSGLLNLSDRIFYNCSAMTSVNIPASITFLNDYTFYGCSSLTSLVLSEAMTGFGSAVFQGCTALASATIPASFNLLSWVSKFSAAGFSGTVNQVSPPPTAPGAPLAVSAVAGDTTAAISWSAPSSNGGSAILRYNVYNNNIFIGFSEGTSYLIESLTNGINYNVLVKAENTVGEGTASSRVYYIPVSTADGAMVASEPQNLAAAAGDGSAALTWDPPSSTGSGGVIVSYNIYVNDVMYANIDGTLSTYTLSPLTNDISYNIKMSSLNMAGESALTSQVPVMPVMPSSPA